MIASFSSVFALVAGMLVMVLALTLLGALLVKRWIDGKGKTP